MKKIRFADRWVSLALEDRLHFKTKSMLMEKRRDRYPKLLYRLQKVTSFFFEYLAPLFMIKKMTRAGALSQIDFLLLLEALQKSRSYWIRMITILVLHPYFEVLFEEKIPLRKKHPLQDYVDQNKIYQDSYEYDFVIIGSGAGGAPLAYDLSLKGYRVAILEKGHLAFPEESTQVVEKHYIQQGILGALDHSLALVMAGSCVGGTTAINSGTCPDPLTSCLAEWDALLQTHFAQGELEPWLSRIKQHLHVAPSNREVLSISSILIEKGMEKINRPETYNLPRNAPGCEGSGRCFVVCPTQAKQSTDVSFIPQAIKNGASLFAGVEAKRIREKSDHVLIDALDSKNSKKIKLKAKHLIISGGALLTPQLIHKNRLGTRWRQAGRGLKIHPASKVYGYFPEISQVEKGVPQGTGYKTDELPRIGFEGVHMTQGLLPHTIGMIGTQTFWWLKNHDHLASFGLFVRDRQAGSVKNVGDKIYLSYKMDAQDAIDLGRGLKIIAQAFFAAGAQKVLMPLIHPLQEISSPEMLDKLTDQDFKRQHLIVSGFHPQGTAAMGRVVDSDLTIIGCNKISVCDASVFPDSPGVNPMITIMALSLRLSDYLAKKYSA
ncbi:MAG: GMC family oxidoreductase [Deltaproteobacteria bacterium]|nr:MAG: GMC family oxidoreductase [Deltaproteobacteria bacterium]